MRPMFTNKPELKSMVTETSEECAGEKFHGTMDFPCINLLCVECGWTGHFSDGSNDHFFNHKCKMRTQSISTIDV